MMARLSVADLLRTALAAGLVWAVVASVAAGALAGGAPDAASSQTVPAAGQIEVSASEPVPAASPDAIAPDAIAPEAGSGSDGMHTDKEED